MFTLREDTLLFTKRTRKYELEPVSSNSAKRLAAPKRANETPLNIAGRRCRRRSLSFVCDLSVFSAPPW
jgi:hypothetical protein